MSGLQAFLKQNAVANENVKFVASKRFVDPKTHEPLEWEIKGISSQEDESLRKASTKKIPTPGKRGQFTQETDYNKYVGLLATTCTVYPNLNDKELQDSYGVMGADSLLKEMLLPGEYANYLEKVQEVCGFDVSLDELVEEAKN